MIHGMYTIADSKTAIFYPPFFKTAERDAIHAFTQLANDEQSNICLYPEDFDLYFIGEYDDRTGKIDSLKTPKHIQKASFLKKTK